MSHRLARLAWTLLLPAAGSAAPAFDPPRFLELSGTDPSALVLADFNLDGLQDAAVAMYGFTGGDGKISLHLGESDGSLTDHPFAVPFQPFGLAACDLDGDAAPDLAVTEGGDGQSVHIYHNDGGARFTHADEIDVTSRFPAAIACADLNADSYPDLAVASAGDGGVIVLFGGSDGRFSPVHVDAARHFQSSAIDSEDMDRDGFPDLLLPQSVLRNDGAGKFTVFAPVGGEAALSLSDINADGLPDLAVADREGINLWAGSTDPASPLVFTTRVEEPQVAALSLHDPDRDGRADLIFTQPAADVVVLRAGTGDGFAPAVSLAHCAAPGPVAVRDADNDGLADVFAACRGLDEQALLAVVVQRPAAPDSPTPLQVGFTQSRHDIPENAGDFEIAVVRNATAGETRVDYHAVSGTATEGVDFSLPAGSLHFSPGVARQVVSVSLHHDSVAEEPETFRILLSNPDGASLAVGETTIVIHDAEAVPFRFASPQRQVREDARRLEIAIERSDAAAAAEVAFRTVDGTATSPADFESAEGQVVFASGALVQTIILDIKSDDAMEGDEFFSIQLLDSAGQPTAKTTVTIIDSTPTATNAGGGPLSPLWLTAAWLVASVRRVRIRGPRRPAARA